MILPREFDFKTESNNGIIYHAEMLDEKCLTTWIENKRKHNWSCTKEEANQWYAEGWWIPIIINKNRRIMY